MSPNKFSSVWWNENFCPCLVPPNASYLLGAKNSRTFAINHWNDNERICTLGFSGSRRENVEKSTQEAGSYWKTPRQHFKFATFGGNIHSHPHPQNTSYTLRKVSPVSRVALTTAAESEGAMNERCVSVRFTFFARSHSSPVFRLESMRRQDDSAISGGTAIVFIPDKTHIAHRSVHQERTIGQAGSVWRKRNTWVEFRHKFNNLRSITHIKHDVEPFFKLFSLLNA